MKDKEKRTQIIFGSLFGVLFILVGLALVFAIADINYDSLSFSLDKGATLIGIFVSTVGLFVAAYFAILAIDAYSSIQEIKKVKEAVLKDQEDITRIKEQLYGILINQDYAKSLYDDLDAQIAVAELAKSENLRNILTLHQARLSYRYPMLDKNIRLSLLLTLADIGELEDINKIIPITLNPNEDREIKEYAELVLEELKKRLGVN